MILAHCAAGCSEEYPNNLGDLALVCIWYLASCFSLNFIVFKLQLPNIGCRKAELPNIQNHCEVYCDYLSLLFFLYCVIKKLLDSDLSLIISKGKINIFI